MSTDRDGAEKLQFAFAACSPRGVLAGLPGVSASISGEFAFTVATFLVR